MSLSWHPAAEEEFGEAAFYYEEQVEDLGDRFVTQVDAALARILTSPLTPRLFMAGCRRFRVDRFPYSVVYREQDGAIQIIAIAHGKRRPGYWRGRLDE